MHNVLHHVLTAGGAWRILRFCCVGAVNTGVAFCLYLLFSSAVNVYLSNALSWCGGCLCGYILNKFWTFRATDEGMLPLIRFVVVNLCSLGLGLTLMHTFIVLGGGRVWSYALSLPFTMITSYLGYRFWSFRKIGGKETSP